MDFEKAIECAENQEVMRIASQRFKIPKEDKNQCKMLGLWDAIKLYDEKSGVPFKLFLSLRVKFRCLHYKNENYSSPLFDYKYAKYGSNKMLTNVSEKKIYFKKITKKDSNESRVRDILLSLDKDEQDLITKRFIENRTLEDIGKEYCLSYETIRKRINIILDKFRD